MSDAILCQHCARKFGAESALAQHMRATHDNPEWRRLKADAQNKHAPLCSVCGSSAKLSSGKWGIKAECCGLWSWGLKPLVDRETHASRIKAHDAFDRLWKNGGLSRTEAYRRLADAMRMATGECHISLMSAEQAKEVVRLVHNGALHRVCHAMDVSGD